MMSPEMIRIRKDPEEETIQALYGFGRLFNKIPTDFENLAVSTFLELSKQMHEESLEQKREEAKMKRKLKK